MLWWSFKHPTLRTNSTGGVVKGSISSTYLLAAFTPVAPQRVRSTTYIEIHKILENLTFKIWYPVNMVMISHPWLLRLKITDPLARFDNKFWMNYNTLMQTFFSFSWITLLVLTESENGLFKIVFALSFAVHNYGFFNFTSLKIWR